MHDGLTAGELTPGRIKLDFASPQRSRDHFAGRPEVAFSTHGSMLSPITTIVRYSLGALSLALEGGFLYYGLISVAFVQLDPMGLTV